MSDPQILLPKPCGATQQTFSRRVCLEDFLDDEDDDDEKNVLPTKHKYNKNYSYNKDVDIIAKNQQEFGHRKRIKP